MNKLVAFVALLACVGIVNATCTTNAAGTDTACLCNQGYWGTSAEGSGGASTACTGNTTTSVPGTGITASGLNASACKTCLANFYQATAATSSAAATCTACPAFITAPAGSTAASSCVAASNSAVIMFSVFVTFLALFL